MNTVFKVMIFSIVLNFAVGIIFTAIPELADTGTGLSYNEDYASGFTGELEDDITPSGDLEDKGNQGYRILDMLNIGFIGKFLRAVDNYLYGFINLLEGVLGGFLDPAVKTMIFDVALKTLLTVGYILGGFWLWTGRDMRN